MTVKELIALLSKYPEDTEILTYNGDDFCGDYVAPAIYDYTGGSEITELHGKIVIQ